MTIQEAIRQIALTGLEIQCKICTVDSVDAAARTVDCTPIDEGAPLVGVNLQANQESSDGIVLLPAVGSYVIVSFIDQSVAAVVLTEKIDKAIIKIEGTTLEITSAGITLNGGKLGGLIKIDQIIGKINALENDINNLKTVFATWVPAATDGGAALKTAASLWAAQQFTPTQKNELEDDKIKH